MLRAPSIAAPLLFTLLLAACGGGGGGSPASTGTTANLTATGQSASATTGSTSGTGTGASDTGNSGTGTGTTGTGASGTGGSTATGSTTPSASPFIASVTVAPDDGATVSNTITLEVRGSSLENVELLPQAGYSPRLGVFTISPDKTAATLNFDTTSLPNGTLRVRISAYNRPPGSSDASEIVAMAPRSWLLRNSSPAVPAEVPSALYMPEAWFTLGDLPRQDPAQLNNVRAMSDAEFSDLVTNRWTEFEAILRFYVPVNVVFVPPTPLNFQGAWASCLRDHGPPACREAILYLPS
jgi:hypothetical protein